MTGAGDPGDRFLDRALVGPLLEAMHGTPRVRRALFGALIRLPLDPSDWSELAQYAAWVIDTPASAEERTEVVEAAPFVPVRSVRERVARVAQDILDPDRAPAAMGLALLGDPRAVPALVEAADSRDGPLRVDAARRLATLDVSGHRDALVARCRAATGESPADALLRFWLAVALARSEADGELRRLFEQGLVDAWELRPIEPGNERSGAPGLSRAKLVGPPLPDATVRWLTGLVEQGHPRAPLARLIVEASSGRGPEAVEDQGTKLAPAWAVGTTPGGTPPSDAALIVARAWVGDLGLLGEDGHLREEVSGPLTERAPGPFEVTALFELAGTVGEVGLGNWLVAWVARFQRDFRPDVAGLVHTYAATERAAAGFGGLRAIRWQQAWVASRAGLPGVVEAVAPSLAAQDEDIVVSTAHLLADAADSVMVAWAPEFGGGAAPGGPAPAMEVLVDDWSGAAGPHDREAGPPEAAVVPTVSPDDADADDEATRGIDFGIPQTPETPAGEARWILAQAYDASDPVRPVVVDRALKAGAPHLVQVQLGPERADMLRAAGGPSIDEVLPADGSAHDLVLVFVPAGGVAQSAPVTLPPVGSTEVRTFAFQAGAAGSTFEAQVIVLHQNRVLQTAFLSAPVLDDPAAAPAGARLDFTLAVVRPGLADLGSRSRFDAAVVVDHAEGGRPVATAVRDDRVARFDDAGIERAAANISAILTDLADNPDRYAPPLDSGSNVDLIRQLAFQGVELFGAFGRHVVRDLAGDDITSIQVLQSDPNDVLPVEFVYDLPTPTTTAGLCPGWRAALETGACDPANHPDDGTGLATVVCPSGFWCLSKVIERQVVDRGDPLVDLLGKDFAVRAEPGSERRHLPPMGSALLGASKRVDMVKPGRIDEVLATLDELHPGAASRADRWADWVQGVSTLRPSLLVLLSHTERAQGSVALEIGDGDRRLVAQITPSVVGDAPIVLLLGCDTAIAHRELQTFVAQFRDNGAALVVGTVAAVLGEHAAPVAQAIARALHAAAAAGGRDGATFGIVMRDVRRRILAEGELMALCLATYGDADWRVSGG